MWICQRRAYFKFIPSTHTHTHSHTIWGLRTDEAKSGHCRLYTKITAREDEAEDGQNKTALLYFTQGWVFAQSHAHNIHKANLFQIKWRTVGKKKLWKHLSQAQDSNYVSFQHTIVNKAKHKTATVSFQHTIVNKSWAKLLLSVSCPVIQYLHYSSDQLLEDPYTAPSFSYNAR